MYNILKKIEVLYMGGSIPCRSKGFLLQPVCPDQLWQPSLLYNGYQGQFPWGKSVAGAWRWQLTYHHPTMSKLTHTPPERYAFVDRLDQVYSAVKTQGRQQSNRQISCSASCCKHSTRYSPVSFYYERFIPLGVNDTSSVNGHAII
jgi:hypothetical protein